jgi:LmbE family N-acetylglucosaminyl deacetylase
VSAAPRLLVTVAHPDDETFGCGSLLLHAAARGAHTCVCCATRGEEGEPAPGSDARAEELGLVRERELRAAAGVLGVDRVELLGYRDSGMQGAAGDGALVDAPLGEVAAAVRGVIDAVRPHVVVTLSADDGHRDHARIRDATMAAARAASWRPQRVYLHCLPRSLLRRWADRERLRRPDSPYVHVDAASLGTADEELTTVIDTSAHLAARRSAIACHRSQRSPYEGLPPDLERAFLGEDHLVRVAPTWTGGAVERDLLAGIDLIDG